MADTQTPADRVWLSRESGKSSAFAPRSCHGGECWEGVAATVKLTDATRRPARSVPVLHASEAASGKVRAMTAGRARRGAVLSVAVCAGLALLPGCSGGGAQSSSTTPAKSGTFSSPSQELGNGRITTYVTLNDGGEPTEVGVRLTPSALDGLPPSDTTLMIDMPDQAEATAFDHVMLNWNHRGHEPPELFGRPHFDFHFDMVDMATIEAINPDDPNYAAKAEHLPEAQYVPQDYAVPPGPPAATQAVPKMGVHLADSSDTSLIPGEYNFTQIIINGVWDGRYTFIEPMITRDWLMTEPDLEQPLKQPDAYQETGYYPTTYAVHVDQQTREYVVSLTDLTMRTAS